MAQWPSAESVIRRMPVRPRPAALTGMLRQVEGTHLECRDGLADDGTCPESGKGESPGGSNPPPGAEPLRSDAGGTCGLSRPPPSPRIHHSIAPIPVAGGAEAPFAFQAWFATRLDSCPSAKVALAVSTAVVAWNPSNHEPQRHQKDTVLKEDSQEVRARSSTDRARDF